MDILCHMITTISNHTVTGHSYYRILWLVQALVFEICSFECAKPITDYDARMKFMLFVWRRYCYYTVSFDGFFCGVSTCPTQQYLFVCQLCAAATLPIFSLSIPQRGQQQSCPTRARCFRARYCRQETPASIERTA